MDDNVKTLQQIREATTFNVNQMVNEEFSSDHSHVSPQSVTIVESNVEETHNQDITVNTSNVDTNINY